MERETLGRWQIVSGELKKMGTVCGKWPQELPPEATPLPHCAIARVRVRVAF